MSRDKVTVLVCLNPQYAVYCLVYYVPVLASYKMHQVSFQHKPSCFLIQQRTCAQEAKERLLAFLSITVSLCDLLGIPDHLFFWIIQCRYLFFLFSCQTIIFSAHLIHNYFTFSVI